MTIQHYPAGRRGIVSLPRSLPVERPTAVRPCSERPRRLVPRRLLRIRFGQRRRADDSGCFRHSYFFPGSECRANARPPFLAGGTSRIAGRFTFLSILAAQFQRRSRMHRHDNSLEWATLHDRRRHASRIRSSTRDGCLAPRRGLIPHGVRGECDAGGAFCAPACRVETHLDSSSPLEHTVGVSANTVRGGPAPSAPTSSEALIQGRSWQNHCRFPDADWFGSHSTSAMLR
jgi:hypothetical protein